MKFQLELEVLKLQVETQDLLATEQEVMALQLGEDSLQRMQQLDDGRGDGVDDDAEVTRKALLKKDESSEAYEKMIA